MWSQCFRENSSEDMLHVFPLIAVCIVAAGLVRSVPQGRILGGREAVDGQFPYQASLMKNQVHICGGAILSTNYVLTAAHCVTRLDDNGNFRADDPQLYTVLVGTANLRSGGVVRAVESMRPHEDFEAVENDVALVKLFTPLAFSTTIQPVPLASAELAEYSPVTISGWGRTRNNGMAPSQLRWSVFAAMSAEECFERINILSDKMICLGHGRDNGVCSGDSGGPAVFNGVLVGVANFVVFECGTIYPDGYAKVLSHVDWIKKYSYL